MRAALALLTSLLGGACALAADSLADLRGHLSRAGEARILFVGNSYSFKVPAEFAKLAREQGKRVEVEKMTKGGWTLKRHAESKETLAKIRAGDWDVVVFQEQSQLPAFSKSQRKNAMIPFAKTLADECRKAGGRPVFFQTWGRRDGDVKNAKAYPEDTFAKMQKRLETGYREAAAAAGGALIVPVGEAWAREMDAGKGRSLYSKDGSHPSAQGVTLTAKVFLDFFYGP